MESASEFAKRYFNNHFKKKGCLEKMVKSRDAAIRAECAGRGTDKFCELSQGPNPNYGCSPDSWCWKKCECDKARALRAAIMGE